MLGKDFSIRQCVKDIYTKFRFYYHFDGFLPAILSAPLFMLVYLWLIINIYGHKTIFYQIHL